MAKEEVLKTDYAEAAILFNLAKKQVLNRTQEAIAVNILAENMAKSKGASVKALIRNLNALKGNLTKARKNGNIAIADYRKKILSAIKDAGLKEKIEKIPAPIV